MSSITNADLPTLEFFFEYHLCDGNRGTLFVSTKQNNVWQNIIAAVYLKVFNLNELLNI